MRREVEQTGKKLFQYALLFKRPILLALLLLALAVSTELMAPYIAKTMIDQNIEGIEKGWREVPANGPNAVHYNGKWYKRDDRLAPGDRPTDTASIVQVGRSYYWLPGPPPQEGKRVVEGGRLTVTTDSGQTSEYAVQPLSRSEVYAFYKPEIPRMLMMAGAYFVLLALAAFFTYGQRRLLQTSANRVVQRMREDVFAHIQRLPVRYFDNLPAGKVVSRVTNDTEAVRELFVAVLANFFSGAIYITATMAALFLLDTRLALIALPLVPLLPVWIIVYRRFAGTYNSVIRSKLSDINAMINESIQGMPIIQAFRREQRTIKEFDELNGEYYTYQNRLLSLNALTSHNMVNLIRNIVFIVVLWMFWGGSLRQVVSVGVLYAFIEYMNRMFQPIVGVVNQLANLETARVSAGRVFELLEQPGIEVASGSIPRYKGDVAFENVSFAYNKGDYVLHDISFRARQGETVALVGHTGSGKSSILNLLFRFYDVEEGRITIDGMDTRDIPKQMLRRHMGIVLQDPFLFTGTIASNVSLDTPGITRERVEQALKDVGAYDMFMALPGGLDHPVIEKGSTLSAGQRQLISFARALAHDPAIFILDEATSSIDTETEAVIQQALDVVKKGRTTFVIAHRLSTIRSADHILVLDRGRIVESGNHETLMQKGGKYYAMYQLQSGAAPSPAETPAPAEPGAPVPSHSTR